MARQQASGSGTPDPERRRSANAYKVGTTSSCGSWRCCSTPSTAQKQRSGATPPTEHYAKCRQKAYNFIAEARLHTWVEQQNYQTGLAPTSEELIHEYARAWPHSGVPGIQNTARFLLSSKPWARRKWAQRWRRRWKVSHRKLKILPPMSREECEKKVIFGRRF